MNEKIIMVFWMFLGALALLVGLLAGVMLKVNPPIGFIVLGTAAAPVIAWMVSEIIEED